VFEDFSYSLGIGILGSPDSGSCIDPPLRATRMPPKALHAAWRRSTSCGGGWDMQREECSGPLRLMCVDQAVLVGMRHPRLGPKLHRRHALCGPCVSRTGSCPSVCGRRSRAELHIQDIRPRMLPSSAAPRRGASRTHPCCSFPCSALRAHGTLHSHGRGKHLRVLCTTNLEVRQTLTHHQRSEPTHTLRQGSAPS
jgi:hypothetical protein